MELSEDLGACDAEMGQELHVEQTPARQKMSWSDLLARDGWLLGDERVAEIRTHLFGEQERL